MTEKTMWRQVTHARSGACPDASDLARFVDGHADANERESMIEHLAECSECADAAAAAVAPDPVVPLQISAARRFTARRARFAIAGAFTAAAALIVAFFALRQTTDDPSMTVAARVERALGRTEGSAFSDLRPVDVDELERSGAAVARGRDKIEIVAPRNRSPLERPELIVRLPAGTTRATARFLDTHGAPAAAAVALDVTADPARIEWPQEARRTDGVVLSIDVEGVMGADEAQAFVTFAAPEERERWARTWASVAVFNDPVERRLVLATAAYRAGYFAEAAAAADEARALAPNDAFVRRFAEAMRNVR